MENSCERTESPKTFRDWIQSAIFWKNVRAIAIGAILGYFYFRFNGPGNVNDEGPILPVITGAFLGFFFVNRPCRSC